MSPRILYGTLCPIGSPSRKPPKGGRGHPIVVPWEVAQRFHGTVSVNVKHTSTVVGWAESVFVADDRVRFQAAVCGPVPYLGVSFELQDARIADTRERVWWVTDAELVGIAVVPEPAFAETGFD